jgi:tRNA-Thr(GGU) m(6)t(6)A37 methyltransferase TsaA
MSNSLRFQGHSATFRSIGVVENDFDDPVDPDRLQAVESQVIIDNTLVDGLEGLESGQQIMVIFHFHKVPKNYELHQHPRGDSNRPQRGVFALRSPHRPNPIGVTVVDLLRIEGNVLYVRGLDALNDTPVLDIKPIE